MVPRQVGDVPASQRGMEKPYYEKYSSFTHADLCSGIGGFSLAAAWLGFRTVLHCEIDTWCQRVLTHWWGDVPIVPDLWEIDAERLANLGVNRVDLLTAGLPCQPHSLAGKRKASEDSRELSEGMLSVVRAMAQTSAPKIIVVENVLGFAADGDLEHDGGIDELSMGLERLAYETRPLVLPASAVGAAHRRDRVFLVATSRALADAHRVAARSSMAQHADGGRPLVPTGSLTGIAGGPCAPMALRAPWDRPNEPVWRTGGDDDGRSSGEDKAGLCGSLYGLSPGLDRADARRVKALGNSVVPMQVLPVLRAARAVLQAASQTLREPAGL